MWDYVHAHPFLSLIGAFIVFLVAVALRDIFQRKHTIKHNFPIVGNIRYWLETVGPELRQYWVASDQEELPSNRSERAWIYASAKGQNNTFGLVSGDDIELSTGSNKFTTLRELLGYSRDPSEFTKMENYKKTDSPPSPASGRGV